MSATASGSNGVSVFSTITAADWRDQVRAARTATRPLIDQMLFEIEKMVLAHRYLYAKGEALISNEEYDHLISRARKRCAPASVVHTKDPGKHTDAPEDVIAYAEKLRRSLVRS